MRSLIRIIDQKSFSIYILLLSDVFWFNISFFSAYVIRNFLGNPIQEFDFYLRAIPWVIALQVSIFYLNGLYEKKNRISNISEIYLICKSVTVCLILLMATSFMEKVDYSRGMVLIFWVTSLLFINLGRYFIRLIKRNLIRKGYGIINVLIIGAGKAGRSVAKNLEQYYDFGYRIQGFLDDQSSAVYGKYRNYGSTDDITRIIQEKAIDEVIISDPCMSHEKILNLIHKCDHLSVKFKVVSDLFEIIAGSIDISEIEGIPALNMKQKSPSVFYSIVKRMLDVICSAVGIIMLIPLWVILGLIIKLDSPGSIFFKQERIGQFGNPFWMYKFRTMHTKYSGNEISPSSEGDHRITRLGKFLRKTSLDETPQLINVLFGSMSLVGPRPEMRFLVEKYREWQKKRLDVKPGMTGLWQILGRKDLPLAENLEYDFYYIKNQSILLDIVILFKTFTALIMGKGAY